MIYELDDCLQDIPEWNYASGYYSKTEELIKKMMSMSDAMVVSTEALKETYSPYNAKIAVIPNHLPKFIWGEPVAKTRPRELKDRPRIGWCGSENHFIHPITPEYKKGIRGGDFGTKLMEFIRGTVDKYQWVLSGAKPIELVDLVDSGEIEFHGWYSVLEYPAHARRLDLDIGIAPLMPCHFNDHKCLVGDTKVITNRGIIPIRNVERNDKIWQRDGYRNVNAVISYINKDTIKIKTRRGYEIEGTPKHRLRSNDKFKKMCDFKIGDTLDLNMYNFSSGVYQTVSAPFFLTKKLLSIDMKKVSDDMMPSITVNERWGRFIGYTIGDGNIRYSDSISFSCSVADSDFISDVMVFCDEIGLVPMLRKSEKGKGYTIILNSRNLKYFFTEKIGIGGSGEKKNLFVPPIILRSPKSVIKEFLRGLFETDGSVSRTSMSFCTKSKRLAQDVQFLLLGFGIISDMKSTHNKTYNKDYYHVILYRHASELFYNEIGFISDRKNGKLRANISKPHSNAYRPMILHDIIETIEYGKADVYDVDVDGHYYNANGIVSHNSNIKALEAAALGFPTVYSGARPYRNMTLNTDDEDLFIGHIERLASDVDYRMNTYQLDYDIVKDQLYWEDNNKLNLKRYVNSYLELFGKTLNIS